MNTVAMWVGYVVIAMGTLSLVSLIVGTACNYAWQKILRDAPSIYYVWAAVSVYREKYPPSRWVHDNIRTPKTGHASEQHDGSPA